ncbi:hypothetical protein HOLleu_19713 [Holothuria leucospilota]|uniref:Uncharacterized protein n=1 Tax=Holothuria leucospilota TaxID=206669 RepID=A0A9Q1BYS4_HOLLE|nr:hypothetical protein HOLleu_19713 [Holothuria leucospilota]
MDPANDGGQVCGNNLQPVIATGAVPTTANPYPNTEGLKGSKVRKVTGVFQMVCGTIEVAFAIVVLCLPLQKKIQEYYYVHLWSVKYSYTTEDVDETDKIGWGIWNGLFAIVTGCLGLYSKRSKYMVAAYMATSIIATLSSISCLIWAAVSVANAIGESMQYVHDNQEASLAMYIILSIVFAVQMVMSILGASFTCGAFSSRPENNQLLAVYYCVTQPQHQQTDPVFFYNQAPAPPPEYDASLKSVIQSTSPNGDEIK